MQPTVSPIDELQESCDQLLGAWRTMVSPMEGAILQDLPGLHVCWANTQLPVYNALMLAHPVTNSDDLEARLQTAVAFMSQQPRAGLLFLCSDWLPADLRDTAPQRCEAFGLHPALPITGMAAPGLPTPKPLPPPLELRPVNDDVTRLAVSDINCTAYRFPLLWGHETIAKAEAWRDDYYGVVAYHDNQAAACAVTFPVDNRLYVALVATHPQFQRRGYASAAMRQSLANAATATGLQRTTLHATPAGQPVYERLGYHPTARFMGYTRPPSA